MNRIRLFAAAVAAAVMASFAPGAAQAQTGCPPGYSGYYNIPGTTTVIFCNAPTYTDGYYGIYATEPRAGSPNSMQFQAASVALDLASLQDAELDISSPDGDADTVGGAVTYFDAGDQHGERYEGRYQHTRRMGEGTRSRFLLDVPIHILHADTLRSSSGATLSASGTAAYGTLSAGIELPVDTDAYNSVGGYVFGELGRLPKRGDTITSNGYTLRVEAVRENRIEAVRISGSASEGSGGGSVRSRA